MLRPWTFEDAALRPSTRGWVLAGILVGGTVVAVLLAMTPETSLARAELTVTIAVAQVVLAAAAVRLREHTTGLVVLAVLAVLLVTVLVADADTLVRVVLASSAYTYLVLYAAYAFERAAMRGILALVTLGSAIGGLVSPLGFRPMVWLCTVVGVSAAGAVVGELVARLRLYATIDSLTGVLNRTAFDAVATAAIAGSLRRSEDLVLAIIDLDEFKNVNDTHGHAAGDVMLGRVVDAWSDRLRTQDLLGRIGGDEFALLLPATTIDGATALLDDLAEVSPLAFSAGLAGVRPGDDVAALRRRADAGMYEVKRSKPHTVG
ncbi:diguanylate cyclase [Actinotalea sp.]|uniref:GGDEF domain-containing protein n=1 Tax=Actinotalea sp. TaxID=1872145 RepID=UPI0035627E54